MSCRDINKKKDALPTQKQQRGRVATQRLSDHTVTETVKLDDIQKSLLTLSSQRCRAKCSGQASMKEARWHYLYKYFDVIQVSDEKSGPVIPASKRRQSS